MGLKKKVSKKAQITIFVILALALLLVIILLLLNTDRINVRITPEPPIEQIRTCIREEAEQARDIISVQGGSFRPENYYIYQGNKVDYLCYTEENFKKCVMQKPFLKSSIEKELEDYLLPKVKRCIDSVKTSLEGKGYSVTLTNPESAVSLLPGSILIEVYTNLRIAKDNIESYESIKIDVDSELNTMTAIASAILNWEARYGDSEIKDYMIYYPYLRVEKKKQGDGSTIYIITDKETKETFMFAVRSVALIPEIG